MTRREPRFTKSFCSESNGDIDWDMLNSYIGSYPLAERSYYDAFYTAFVKILQPKNSKGNL
ncbi:MAG: hypothetical protein U9O98_00795 [Asgard group archaeon]|nr:hypothetical protein [Asgard group archaeon]